MRTWGEARDWRGYDPYDALNSPLAPVVTLGTALGRRMLTQVVKLSPLNLRPALLIRTAWNEKAIALVASAYARLAAAGDETAREPAARWLSWLAERGPGWGYHFPVQTRVFRYERGTPNTIATSFAAQALLDGCELLRDDRWRGPALASARFLEERMLEDGPRPYFRYLPGEGELVHNANLLGCAVLARGARVLAEEGMLDTVRRAVETTVEAQRPDGSWPYSEAHGWVDNFHTAYVLEALAECARSLPELLDAQRRGYEYWERELFLDDGTPKYFPDRTYPLDAHCYASAVDAWVAVGALEPAERTARLLVERMLRPDGSVRFQVRPRWRSNVPFVRWTTAPSFRALAGLGEARARLG